MRYVTDYSNPFNCDNVIKNLVIDNSKFAINKLSTYAKCYNKKTTLGIVLNNMPQKCTVYIYGIDKDITGEGLFLDFGKFRNYKTVPNFLHRLMVRSLKYDNKRDILGIRLDV